MSTPKRTYHGPPADEQAQHMIAAKRALADLSPEARAEINARMTNLRRIEGCAELTGLEIIAALAMMTGERR